MTTLLVALLVNSYGCAHVYIVYILASSQTVCMHCIGTTDQTIPLSPVQATDTVCWYPTPQQIR